MINSWVHKIRYTSPPTGERNGWILPAIKIKASTAEKRWRNLVCPSFCVTTAGASTSLTSRINGITAHNTDAWRIRDCRSASCSENWVWEAMKKSGWGVSWMTSELSSSTPTSGRLQQPRAKGERRRTTEQGAERFMAKWIAAEKVTTGLQHAVVYVRARLEGSRRGKPKASGLVLVRSPLLTSHKWRELVSSGRLVCRCRFVFLWCYVSFVSFSS